MLPLRLRKSRKFRPLTQVLAHILAGFFLRIDFPPELLSFDFHRPVDVRRDERRVAIIWIAGGIEDSDLLTHLFKNFSL